MNTSAIQKLKRYFRQDPNILLAFLFGSAAKNRETEDSDVDIALFLKDKKEESAIWTKISTLLKKEIDLVLLDEAPATLVSAIFKTGIALVVKDEKLYWNLYLQKSMESEDFANFADSYWGIYLRSRSLIPEDKARLLERLQFLEQELSEIDRFKNITFQEYQQEKPKRREIERWVENIINAMIDIAKIFLASEKKDMPKTYEEALRDFALIAGLKEKQTLSFSQFARLRNILAHEYLGVLYGEIRNFIEGFPILYEKISKFLMQYLKNKRIT